MYNLLIDELPTTVNIAGYEIPIRTDFRVWVAFELLMSDTSIDDDLKLLKVMEIAFDEGEFAFAITEIKEAVNQIIYFYSCFKYEDKKESKEDKKKKKQKVIYSFQDDAEMIFSAFLEQYGIDLTISYLHWFKFQALLSSLRDCKFTDVMAIRSKTIDKDMSDQEKKYYREMKAIYAISDRRTQEEKEADFANDLMML